MKTKVTGKYVIGFDGTDHVIYENGEVVYENDSILYVGHDYPDPVDTTIEAGQAIISPGFIDLNALGDIDHAILDYEVQPEVARGLTWSEAYVLAGPREAMTAEEEAFKSLYAFAQLIYNGITTALPVTSLLYKQWAETYDEFNKIVEIVASLGLRAYLGPSYRSGVKIVKANGSPDIYWDDQRGLDGLEEAVAFIKKHEDTLRGLVKGLLVPSTIETCTPELLQRTKQYSDELSVPIRLHAGQSLNEFELIRKWYGQTPVEFLEALEFLGPRTMLAHAIYVTGHSQVDFAPGRDRELLRDSDTTVIHCPMISARHGGALESFAQYSRQGIRLGMGTDTFPPDMILTMSYGNHICRVVEGDINASRAADFFRAATLGGAKALGRDDLGRLAAGAKADIIIIGLDDFRTGPIDDPIRTMFLNTTGADVQTVVINGRTVMQDRKIPGINLEQLGDDAQDYFEKMKKAYTHRDYLHRPIDKLFPPSFRMINQGGNI